MTPPASEARRRPPLPRRRTRLRRRRWTELRWTQRAPGESAPATYVRGPHQRRSRSLAEGRWSACPHPAAPGDHRRSRSHPDRATVPTHCRLSRQQGRTRGRCDLLRSERARGTSPAQRCGRCAEWLRNRPGVGPRARAGRGRCRRHRRGRTSLGQRGHAVDLHGDGTWPYRFSRGCRSVSGGGRVRGRWRCGSRFGAALVCEGAAGGHVCRRGSRPDHMLLVRSTPLGCLQMLRRLAQT